MAFAGGLMGDDKGPTLRGRILYTFLLLLLFRLLAQIPAANVDEERLHQLLASNPLLGVVDVFAGGEVLTHFSLVAAGIVPYMVAFFLVEFTSLSIPSFGRLWGVGEYSAELAEKKKKRMELTVKIVSIPLAFLFAWLLSQYLGQESGVFPKQMHWFTPSGFRSSLWTISLVTAGSLASTWIASVITKKGIGEGKDVILLVGSSLSFGKQMAKIAGHAHDLAVKVEWVSLGLLGGVAVAVAGIYLLETVRRIPVEFASRPARPGKERQHQPNLPLLLSIGGIRPVIAAIGVMAVPAFFQTLLTAHSAGATGVAGRVFTAWINPRAGWYWLTLACLIVLFTFLYNISGILRLESMTEMPLAETLKRQGAYIPGFRPGKMTHDYLLRVVRALAVPGGMGFAVLAAGVPYLILRLTGVNTLVTVLSIVVVVETVENLRSRMEMYRTQEAYTGLLHSARLRG